MRMARIAVCALLLVVLLQHVVASGDDHHDDHNETKTNETKTAGHDDHHDDHKDDDGHHDDHGETKTAGHDAHGHAAHGPKAWVSGTMFSLAKGTYDWKLQFQDCMPDRFAWMMVNAGSEGLEHAEEEAETLFTFTNPKRTVFTDKTGADNEAHFPDDSKHIFQLVFNRSKATPCAAAATPAPAEAPGHEGHGHRRSGDDHAGHGHDEHAEDATKMTMEFKIETAGNYVLFADVDITAYSANLFAEGSEVALVPVEREVIPGHAEFCAAPAVAAAAAAAHNDDLDTSKWMYSFAILMMAALGCFLPLVVSKTFADLFETVQVVGNCFAGGILFAVAVQHIIPECIELYPPSKTDSYPLAVTCVVMGFCFMLFVENIIKTYAPAHLQHHHTTMHTDNAEVGAPVVSELQVAEPVESADAKPMEEGRACCSFSESGTGSGAGMELVKEDLTVSEEEMMPIGILQAATLVLGLGVHSLFEGLALGLTTKSDTIAALFAGIIAHKAFAAFAVGSIMLKHHAPLPVFGLAGFTFSVLTPLGTWIGIGIDNNNTNEANGIFSAFAAGIIIHVALLELLEPLITNPKGAPVSVLLLAAAFVLGCFVMSLVAINSTQGGAHAH